MVNFPSSLPSFQNWLLGVVGPIDGVVGRTSSRRGRRRGWGAGGGGVACCAASGKGANSGVLSPRERSAGSLVPRGSAWVKPTVTCKLGECGLGIIEDDLAGDVGALVFVGVVDAVDPVVGPLGFFDFAWSRRPARGRCRWPARLRGRWGRLRWL